jgi:hypothetical protein
MLWFGCNLISVEGSSDLPKKPSHYLSTRIRAIIERLVLSKEANKSYSTTRRIPACYHMFMGKLRLLYFSSSVFLHQYAVVFRCIFLQFCTTENQYIKTK